MDKYFSSTIIIKHYGIKYFILIILCYFDLIPVNPDPRNYRILLVWLPVSIFEADIDYYIVVQLSGSPYNLPLYLILAIVCSGSRR